MTYKPNLTHEEKRWPEWVIIEDGDLPVVARNVPGLRATWMRYYTWRMEQPGRIGPTAKTWLQEAGFEVLDILPHPLAVEPGRCMQCGALCWPDDLLCTACAEDDAEREADARAERDDVRAWLGAA